MPLPRHAQTLGVQVEYLDGARHAGRGHVEGFARLLVRFDPSIIEHSRE